jgi:cytochrome c oxidase subunit II
MLQPILAMNMTNLTGATEGPSTDVAAAVDNISLFLHVTSGLMLALVTGLMLYFVIRYRRTRHPKAVQVKSSVALEVTWTVIPTILVLAMFWYGYEGFKMLREVPDGAMEVKVTARMWNWTFEYDNGKTSNELYVPVDRPVKLLMNSVDVIHSFYVPAFRVKEDVVPGQESMVWFKANSLGRTDIFCAEYCGEAHAYMLSQVVVMEDDEFEEWVASDLPSPDPDATAALNIMDEHDCTGCHSLSGSHNPDAPSLKEIFGRDTLVERDGKVLKLVADEEYLIRAIRDPQAELVKGYAATMEPPEDLSEEDLGVVVDYLKGLK